jgi:hypothetical protein
MFKYIAFIFLILFAFSWSATWEGYLSEEDGRLVLLTESDTVSTFILSESPIVSPLLEEVGSKVQLEGTLSIVDGEFYLKVERYKLIPETYLDESEESIQETEF